MAYNRNNQNYARLKLALSLSDAQVSLLMNDAGAHISKSKANAWARGRASGRVVAMTDDQFDLFCSGLIVWCQQPQPAAAEGGADANANV